jgi:hypothetical protein
LGSNCKLVLLAAVSPASTNVSETRNTLIYAQSAKSIVNEATQNNSAFITKVLEAKRKEAKAKQEKVEQVRRGAERKEAEGETSKEVEGQTVTQYAEKAKHEAEEMITDAAKHEAEVVSVEVPAEVASVEVASVEVPAEAAKAAAAEAAWAAASAGVVAKFCHMAAETLNCIVCHNHEQSLQFDSTIFDSLDVRSFEQAKRNLLDHGILSKQLLRRLWAPIGLTDESYKIMRNNLLTKFEVAIEMAGTGSLLVPTFLPQYLPASIWPPECAAGTIQLQWWYAIRSFQPSGLMERMIVLVQEAGYTQFRCAKEAIVLRGAGGCEMLCELALNSEFNEEGVRVSVRGPQAEEGAMGVKGWQHAKRILATLDKLLEQSEMMVFKYIVVERQAKAVCAECSEPWPESTKQAVCTECGHGHFNDQSGEPAYVPLLQAQSARKDGELTMVLPPDPNAGWGLEQEVVTVEKLLGPVDDKSEAVDEEDDDEEEEEAEEAEAEEQKAEEQKAEEQKAEEEALIRKAQEAEEEEEFEEYRVIIESMQKAGQQWIMLSYCWGKRDPKTGQYDMQQTVIKVFRRLVHTHGLPVWIDIFGGTGGDVYEVMGKGVRGAALVVPFLSSAYDTSANGKRELKFACNLDKPLVPVMAEAGFNHSKDSNWLNVCVAGELYYPIENKSKLAFESQIDDLAAAIKKQLQGMDLQLTWPGATLPPNAAPASPTMGVGLLDVGTKAQQMNPVATLLFENGLSRYAEVFDEEGYDDLDDLKQMALDEDEEWRMLLMRSKMKPPHQRGLRHALGLSSDAAADAANAVASTAAAADTAATAPHHATDDIAAASVISPPSVVFSSITITEQLVDIAPTAAEKKQYKKKDKRHKLIELVNDKLREDVSDQCDALVTLEQLNLDFAPEQDGETQKLFVYDSNKHTLIALRVVTMNSKRGAFTASIALTVQGMLWTLNAHDGEGRQALAEIGNEKNEARRNFAIEQLAKKLLLPPLPEEEFLLVLSRSDYESCHQKCLNANPRVHPYNGDELAHQQELKTFHFHGMGSRYSTKVLYRLYPDTRKRTFIPVPEYHQVVFEAKRAEFFEIARQLRAKTIGTKSDEGNVSSKGVNASVGTDGGSVEGAASKSEQQQRVQAAKERRGQGMKQEFRRPKNGKPAFDQDMVHFYHDESDWKAMVNGRMDVEGAQTRTYDCKFAYTAEKSVSGNLEVGLKGIGGLNFGGESANSLSIDETCTVTFWDGDEEA